VRGCVVRITDDIDVLERGCKEAEMEVTTEMMGGLGNEFTVLRRVPPPSDVDVIAVEMNAWGKKTVMQFPVSAIAAVVSPAQV
jgi:hypothetical protein